jgi:uncharacterized protein
VSAVLDNNFCQSVVDLNLVPAFKKSEFFTGFKNAITAIENRLDNPPAAQAIEEPAQPASESFTTITNEQTTSDGGMFMAFGSILGGASFFIFIVIIATMRMWGRVPAGSYSSGGYQRQGFLASNDDERWDNNSSSSSSDSSSSFFSSSSDSSSSSSSSSDSYSGGSSDGGGASGSW